MSVTESWIPVVSGILVYSGIFFILVGSVALLRLPDVYLRMSAATKAPTLGVALVLLGTAVHFRELGITSRAVATIIFMFVTSPVAAHMIAKAGYSAGVPLWEKTQFDDLQEQYDNMEVETEPER